MSEIKNNELTQDLLKSMKDMGIAFVGKDSQNNNIWTKTQNPFGIGKTQPFKPGLGKQEDVAGPLTGIIHQGNTGGGFSSLGDPSRIQPPGLSVFFLFTLAEREQLPYVATGQVVFVQQTGTFFKCTVGSVGDYQYWNGTAMSTAPSKITPLWEEVWVAVTADNQVTTTPVIRKTAIDIKLSPQEQEKYEEFEKLLPTPIKLIEGSKNHNAQKTEPDSNYILSHDPFDFDGPPSVVHVFKKQAANATSPGGSGLV